MTFTLAFTKLNYAPQLLDIWNHINKEDPRYWENQLVAIINSIGLERTSSLLLRTKQVEDLTQSHEVFALFFQLFTDAFFLVEDSDILTFSFDPEHLEQTALELNTSVHEANMVLIARRIKTVQHPLLGIIETAYRRVNSTDYRTFTSQIELWLVDAPRKYNIVTLDLSGIGLTVLPEELEAFSHTVVDLNISANLISTIPPWIEQFTQLKLLTAKHNPYLATLPSSIKNLSHDCFVNILETPFFKKLQTLSDSMTTENYIGLFLAQSLYRLSLDVLMKQKKAALQYFITNCIICPLDYDLFSDDALDELSSRDILTL